MKFGFFEDILIVLNNVGKRHKDYKGYYNCTFKLIKDSGHFLDENWWSLVDHKTGKAISRFYEPYGTNSTLFEHCKLAMPEIWK